MKILFWGTTKGNVGPGNVNKGIIANLTDCFLNVNVSGKYGEVLDAFWKLTFCDMVVVSGVGRWSAILVSMAKFLKKKSAYLMHGCAEQEYLLNGIQPDEKGLKYEKCLWEYSDLILPVSRRYMEWAKKQYPQYAHKMDYVYNGVDAALFANFDVCNKVPGTVAVSGGLSRLKNNLVVAEAVEALEGKACLRIYGGRKQPLPERYRHTERMGKLSNEQFLNQLRQTSLFVLNSLLESFSIAALEALACGCSVLVSEVAGVCDLLALEETDIIHDPMDVDEIRSKIDYLLDHPNYERLRSQFDPEQWSFAKMVENLEAKCEALLRSDSGK